MNEATLSQLKVLVERAVRPVRACIARKRAMREELLAHVTAIFAEESKRGDESTALERAAQRFGAPAELTRQLQAAVPASSTLSMFIETLIGFPPREPTLRLAARHALLAVVLFAAALAIMIVVVGRWSEWLSPVRRPAILMPVFMAILMFGGTIVGRGMSRALFGPKGRDWPRVIAFGIAAWLLVPGVTLAWCCTMTGVFAANLLEVWPLLLSGLLAPLALLIIVSASIAEIRHHEEWASLNIEEKKGAAA